MLPNEISLADAQAVRRDLMAGKKVEWRTIESPIAPEDISQLTINPEMLRDSLLKLKREFPEELGQKSRAGTLFDSRAAVIIHKLLQIDDAAASRQEFWAWLSLKYFWELINWRHGGKNDFAIPENFSITKRYHGLIERLWFRAELGQVDGKDPYKYIESATDRDFWESGVVRRSFSSCRPVARAFVRYQFQNRTGYLHLTDPEGVRELYKRLSRIYATVALDVLDDDNAFTLISDLATGLKRTNRQQDGAGSRK